MAGDYYNWQRAESDDEGWEWFYPARLFDLDSDRELTSVQWCRISTGDYQMVLRDSRNRIMVDKEGNVRTERGQCRLRLVFADQVRETPVLPVRLFDVDDKGSRHE